MRSLFVITFILVLNTPTFKAQRPGLFLDDDFENDLLRNLQERRTVIPEISVPSRPKTKLEVPMGFILGGRGPPVPLSTLSLFLPNPRDVFNEVDNNGQSNFRRQSRKLRCTSFDVVTGRCLGNSRKNFWWNWDLF